MNDRSSLIQMRIVDILRDTFHQSEQILGVEYWDKPLTGNPFRLSGVDLVYLFFELEKAFNMRFDQRHLQQYGFLSVNRIAEVVQCCALEPSVLQS